MSGEESVDEGERKTDDPVRAALDAVGEQARRALESVGPRLVVGIARVDVPREPLHADLADYHLRDIHGAVHDGIAIGADKGNGDTGEDLVGSGGEGPQHRSGLVTIRGFAEDHPVERDGRIGSEHDTGGTERSHGFRSREPLDIVARRLIVQGCSPAAGWARGCTPTLLKCSRRRGEPDARLSSRSGPREVWHGPRSAPPALRPGRLASWNRHAGDTPF